MNVSNKTESWGGEFILLCNVCNYCKRSFMSVAQTSLTLAGLIILTSNNKYFHLHLEPSSALVETCRQRLQPQPHSRHSLTIKYKCISLNEVINKNISKYDI